MKASELVIKLSELIERHGDKPVIILEPSYDIVHEIISIEDPRNTRLYGECFLIKYD